MPPDFLVSASLGFNATVSDRDGVRRSAAGTTVVVAVLVAEQCDVDTVLVTHLGVGGNRHGLVGQPRAGVAEADDVEGDGRQQLQLGIALDAAGYDASVQQIGNRELYEPSLEKGEINVGLLVDFPPEVHDLLCVGDTVQIIAHSART